MLYCLGLRLHRLTLVRTLRLQERDQVSLLLNDNLLMGILNGKSVAFLLDQCLSDHVFGCEGLVEEEVDFFLCLRAECNTELGQH